MFGNGLFLCFGRDGGLISETARDVAHTGALEGSQVTLFCLHSPLPYATRVWSCCIRRVVNHSDTHFVQGITADSVELDHTKANLVSKHCVYVVL